MCIALYKKQGVKLSRELLGQLWDKNKDGGGYLARLNGKGWMHRKGVMEKDVFLNDLDKYLGEDAELVAHMRIKTTGTISPEHTHPFLWTKKDGKNPRYLFHNGTVKFLNPKDDSDSSLLAKILSNYSTEEAHRILTDFAANGCGRFVTFANGKITTFGDEESIEDEGIWFSNKRHLVTNVVTNYQHNYYNGGGSRVHVVTPPPSTFRVTKGMEIVPVDENRQNAINVIAAFYATKNKVVCNENFIRTWADENGVESMSLAILSKIAEFCSDKASDDPFFEFFLAMHK